jgi:hypothetical protein
MEKMRFVRRGAIGMGVIPRGGRESRRCPKSLVGAGVPPPADPEGSGTHAGVNPARTPGRPEPQFREAYISE